MVRAGADDITAIGPAHIVFPAVEAFGREVRERCLLFWERTKTEVFNWEGDPNHQQTVVVGRVDIGRYVGYDYQQRIIEVQSHITCLKLIKTDD